LLEDEQSSKHGGGAAKKVLWCLEFRGAQKMKKKKRERMNEK
jgi:hypothetical protein